MRHLIHNWGAWKEYKGFYFSRSCACGKEQIRSIGWIRMFD